MPQRIKIHQADKQKLGNDAQLKLFRLLQLRKTICCTQFIFRHCWY